MTEIARTYEKARAKVRYSVLRQAVTAIALPAYLIIQEIPGARDRLPEPFDIPDHFGNVNGSLQLGYFAGLVAGKIYERFEVTNESRVAVQKTRTIMALAGFAVGLAMNTIAETKWGQRIFPSDLGTPDAVDLLYGTAAATFAAAVGPSVSAIEVADHPHDPQQSNSLQTGVNDVY